MYRIAPVENSQELSGGDAAMDNTLTGKGDHVSSKNERNTYEQKKAFEFVTQNTERLSDIFNRVIEQLESNSGAENFKFETNLLKLETNISIKFLSLLFLGPRTIEDRSAEGIFIHFIFGDSSEFQFLASIEKHLKQGLTKFVNVLPMLEFRSVDLYEIATEQLKGVAHSMSPTSDDSYNSKPQLKGNLPVNDFKNILNGYENSRPTNGDKNGNLREKTVRLTQRINEYNLLIDNLLNKRSDPAKWKQVKCNIGIKREDDPEHREKNEKDTTMRSERIVIAAVHGNKKRQTISKERESATLKEFFDSKPPDLEAQNSYEVGESLITSRNSRELRDDERHSTMCQEQQLSPVHVPQNSNAGTGQQQDASEEPELGSRQHFAVNLENSGDKGHNHGVHSQPYQDVQGVDTLQYQNTNTEKTVHQSVNSEQQHDMSNEKEHDMDSERLCSVKHKQQNGVNNEQEHSENTGQQHTEQYNAENTGQQHTEQYNAVGTGQQNDVNSQQQHGANKEQHYSDNIAEQPNDDMVQELRETIEQKPWPQCMEDLWIRETAEALRYFGKNKFRCIICNNPTHCPCCRTSPTNEIPMECMQDLEGNRGYSSMQNDGSIIENNTTSDREDHHFESITAAETAHHSWDFDQTLPMKRVSSNIASNRNGIHEAFAMSNKNMLMRLEECFSTPYGKISLRVCNECEGASESHHESPDGQPTQHCNESEQQLPVLKEGESLETSHEEIESNECESIQTVSTPLMTRSEAPGIPVQRSVEAECPSDGRSYRGATRDVNCHHDCSPSNDASMSSTTSQNHQSRNLMDTVQNLTIDGESDATASANTSPSSPLPLPVQATTNHESILEIIDGDNVMNQLYSNVRPEHSTLTIFDDDPRPTNAHWPHSQLRFAREQTGQLISHMSRSSGLQTRVNRLNSRPTTVSVFRTNDSPSGFERRQRDVEAGESFRSHLQSRTQGASTLSSNFPLEEAHEAGSLPPWAAREPSVDLRQAASPAHINLMRRCASFSGWPSESGQCPRVMALAGFYYSGEDRRVNCFYCGLILDSWSPSDDPWDEHARYRPSCQYLLKMRGQQFITQAQIRLGKQGKPPV